MFDLLWFLLLLSQSSRPVGDSGSVARACRSAGLRGESCLRAPLRLPLVWTPGSAAPRQGCAHAAPPASPGSPGQSGQSEGPTASTGQRATTCPLRL